jgi:hypothetical protein
MGDDLARSLEVSREHKQVAVKIVDDRGIESLKVLEVKS